MSAPGTGTLGRRLLNLRGEHCGEEACRFKQPLERRESYHMEELPRVELTGEQQEMPADWLKKDTQARIAESLLRALDPDVQIEWVQEEGRLGTRRVIQLRG